MHRLLPCLAAVAVLAFVAGPARAADDLKGSYSSTLNGTKLTMALDGAGKFTVKVKDDVVVEGTYKIDKDQIEFTDTKGGDSDKGPGKYKWALKDKKLTFTKVADEAKGRSEALTGGAWTAE